MFRDTLRDTFRARRRLLVLVCAAATVAVVLSVVLAERSGETRTAANCPVQALVCKPGQLDTVTSSGPPAGTASTPPPQADDARAPGTSLPSPTTAAPPATRAAAATPTAGTPSGPCETPGACGFPDASTTGPRLPLKTVKSGDMTIRTDNEVIRGWDLTGSLDVYADDVTVIDSRIDSANWWGVNLRPGHHGLRVLHNEITARPGKGPDNGGVDYAVANMSTSSVEVGWNDVSVFGNALSMGQGSLHDNYVHGIVPFINQGGEYQHADAVISNGGGTGELSIEHNTLLNPVPLDKGASASVGLFADSAPVTHTTVDRNWLAGGAYALYGGGPGSHHIVVTGNVFSSQYHPNCGAYGPVTAWNFDGEGNKWSDNRMSGGTPVVPPRP